MHLLSITVACVCIVSCVLGSQQSVAVEGYLTCNGKPYSAAKVKLYDSDTFTLDDKLAETTSDSRGYFKMQGTGSEVSRLNTKFNVYHRCGMSIPVCYYKGSFKIPQSYVTSGSVPSQVYNAQTMELSLLKQSRDCINK